MNKNALKAILFATTVLFSSLVHAASFDCALAKTKVEKSICADKPLSALDDRLAAAYKNALKSWQGKIEAYVKADQRQWLGEIRKADVADGEIDPLCLPQELTSCLTRLYTERINALESKTFAFSGVYRRDKSAKLLFWPGPGDRFQAGVIVRDGAFRKTLDGDSSVARITATSENESVLETTLGDGSGLPDPSGCQLTMKFTSSSVQVQQKGPCSGANYAGTYARNSQDLLANYRYDIFID